MTLEKKGKSAKESAKLKRIVKGQEEIYHDLFRLELQNTVKNISFNANSPILENVPHKHFYHNVDSDGKPQDKCSPTAGHFHYITVKEVDGEFEVECSEPYVLKGRKAEPYKMDKHTHDVTYLVSEQFTRRVMNADALKEISRIENDNALRLSNPL